MQLIILTLYYFCYPLFLILASPAWILKMWRRGGFGTGLLQRVSYWKKDQKAHPNGIYIQAVSVGEVRLAIDLINKLQIETESKLPIVMAVTTATGHFLATKEVGTMADVIYAPVDIPLVVSRTLNRYRPKLIVMIEFDLWPCFIQIANSRKIPILLANARMSPKSEARYLKLRPCVRWIFEKIDRVCLQYPEDHDRFLKLGMRKESLVVTGSLKFDQSEKVPPSTRKDFAEMMSVYAGDKPVVMVLSSHSGEEVWILETLKGLDVFPCVIPRHMERRTEVFNELEKHGWRVALRSVFPAKEKNPTAFIIDSTGELSEWIPLARVAVIGKSFLAAGGQNPVEPLLAGVPGICGHQMKNFQPLTSRLIEAGVLTQAQNQSEIRAAVPKLLMANPKEIRQITQKVLGIHSGATNRTVLAMKELGDL